MLALLWVCSLLTSTGVATEKILLLIYMTVNLPKKAGCVPSVIPEDCKDAMEFCGAAKTCLRFGLANVDENIFFFTNQGIRYMRCSIILQYIFIVNDQLSTT